MEKGQVSIEMIFFVAILFLLFLLVLVNNFDQDYLKRAFESNSIDLGVCNRLSYLISSVYAGGSGEKVSYVLDKNAVVDQNFIYTGGVYCSFIGIATDSNLAAGNVSVKNLNGTVVLQNE